MEQFFTQAYKGHDDERILIEGKIYIFGAHSRAQTLAGYLQYLYPDISVEEYLYDDEEENPSQIGDIKVVRLDTKREFHTDYPVYIGTKGIYHQRISNHLRQWGFTRIYPVTVEMDLRLRNEYVKKYFSSIGRELVKIDMLGTAGINDIKQDRTTAIYVAVCAYDEPLRQRYMLAPYEKKIQVGAALKRQHPYLKGIITDDTGINISDKNRQFCELTALYWIWKNAKEEIIGLVHYRRHFILPEDWPARMLKNKVDVILSIPLYVAPNLAENYKGRHDPQDWEYMMDYLKKRSIKEYQKAELFFKKNLYSPCNMFIMRREVLDALCDWLFPILFAAAEHGGEKEDCYANRYPGFLSERLITFFFEMHRDRYKVVYADKNFLS
nr:DUF4422 domain-containing protein [uncultured Schaedlerella sp.]